MGFFGLGHKNLLEETNELLADVQSGLEEEGVSERRENQLLMRLLGQIRNVESKLNEHNLIRSRAEASTDANKRLQALKEELVDAEEMSRLVIQMQTLMNRVQERQRARWDALRTRLSEGLTEANRRVQEMDQSRRIGSPPDNYLEMWRKEHKK